MFKVKNKDTGVISTVLDVYLDNIFAITFSLYGKMMGGVGEMLKIMCHQIMK